MHPGEQHGRNARFWDKVTIDMGSLFRGTHCWMWTSAVSSSGYGVYWLNGRNVTAHILTYQGKVGPIPEGLELDHLCRVRLCVNPKHLEPVTRRENMLRSPLTGRKGGARWCSCTEKTRPRVYSDGSRGCRACNKPRLVVR